MYKQVTERIYNYFRGINVELDEEKLKLSFADLERYDKEQDENSKLINALRSKILVEKQCEYIKKLTVTFSDRIIFLKGILVSQELYGNLTQRKSGDIDIFIRSDDLMEFCYYLKEEGFSCEIDEAFWGDSIKTEHLRFVKSIWNSVPLIIEIHEKPIYAFEVSNNYFEKIWEHFASMEILGVQSRILELYDRILYYILHYYKHSTKFESRVLLGYSENIRVKNLLDIYCTIKKHDVNFDVLLDRIIESGTEQESLEVIRMLKEILPDVCTDEFVCKLQDCNRNTSKNSKHYWRSRISLRDSVINLVAKNQWILLHTNIDYDYSTLKVITKSVKNLVEYDNSQCSFNCKAQVVDDYISVESMLTKQPDFCWENLKIIVHYHLHNLAEKIYLRKIVVSFVKDDQGYICKFLDGIWDYDFSVKYNLKIIENAGKLFVKIPKEYFKNSMLSYSIVLSNADMWSDCITGKAWDDFSTMKHIKIDNA